MSGSIARGFHTTPHPPRDGCPDAGGAVPPGRGRPGGTAGLRRRADGSRWVGSTISGTVTIRLRRGNDWTILDTVSPNLSYAPEKLSMERVGDAAFGPVDRIGQLTVRNLDIADSRARLEQYAGLGLVGGATGELVGRVTAGESAEITGSVHGSLAETEEAFADAVDSASEGAAFDSGTD